MKKNRCLLFAVAAVCAAALPVGAYFTKKSLSNTGAIVQQRWSSNAFPIRWQMSPKVGANVTGIVSQETVLQSSFFAVAESGSQACCFFACGASAPSGARTESHRNGRK